MRRPLLRWRWGVWLSNPGNHRGCPLQQRAPRSKQGYRETFTDTPPWCVKTSWQASIPRNSVGATRASPAPALATGRLVVEPGQPQGVAPTRAKGSGHSEQGYRETFADTSARPRQKVSRQRAVALVDSAPLVSGAITRLKGEDGVEPSRTRRCNRGRTLQCGHCRIDGKAQLLGRSGSQKTRSHTNAHCRRLSRTEG